MSHQQELFSRFSEPPLARNTDPATSHLAAQEVREQLAGLRLRTYEFVRNHKGKIARELTTLAGDKDARTINRRLNELEKAGLIYRGEERRCEITGRLCATWWPTDMCVEHSNAINPKPTLEAKATTIPMKVKR